MADDRATWSLYRKTLATQDATHAALDRIDRNVADIEMFADMTIEKLRAQNQQVDGITDGLTEVDAKLRQSESLQRRFDLWQNPFRLLFGGGRTERPPHRHRDRPRAASPNPSSRAPLSDPPLSDPPLSLTGMRRCPQTSGIAKNDRVGNVIHDADLQTKLGVIRGKEAETDRRLDSILESMSRIETHAKTIAEEVSTTGKKIEQVDRHMTSALDKQVSVTARAAAQLRRT